MELSNQKPFEQPDAGMFLGTIVDVVDLPNQQTSFGPKNKVRIVWVLGKTDNTPALDSEKKPFRVIGTYNASISEKSKLFELIKQILGTAPPLITTSEQLSQLLIGRANQLFLVKTQDANVPTKFYVNVAGVAPLTPGQVAPVAPQGFVRSKDKPAQVPGQPVQRTATAPAQTTAPGVPATTVAGAPASNNVSF